MEWIRLTDSVLIPFPFKFKQEIKMGLTLSQLPRGFLELQPGCQVSPDSAFFHSGGIPRGLCAKMFRFHNCQLLLRVPEGFFICCVSHAILQTGHVHSTAGILPALISCIIIFSLVSLLSPFLKRLWAFGEKSGKQDFHDKIREPMLSPFRDGIRIARAFSSSQV